MPTFKCAGVTLSYEPRYSEGHVLTATEAAVLSGHLARSAADTLNGAGVTQETFDEKYAAYSFGGAKTYAGDPVTAQAWVLAEARMADDLAAKGFEGGIKAYKATQGVARFKEVRAHYAADPTIRKAAERMVAAAAKARAEAGSLADLL